MDLVKRLLVPLVVLGFVVAAAVSFLGGDTSKTLVAHFPRATSVRVTVRKPSAPVPAAIDHVAATATIARKRDG